MQIELDEDSLKWVRARVEAGDFASVDDAVRVAIRRMMLDDDLPDEDLSWAKPLIDEGLAQLDRGQFFSEEEVFSSVARVIAAHK